MVKNPPANAGNVRDTGSIPGWGRSPGGEHGNLLQYYYLENPMKREAWWAAVHGVGKSRTRLKLTWHTRMVFPVVMYRLGESWTIKMAGCQRIDAFELWCWRRLLRVPWIARRTNQSTLKELNPENSLEGLTLKLKL